MLFIELFFYPLIITTNENKTQSGFNPRLWMPAVKNLLPLFSFIYEAWWQIQHPKCCSVGSSAFILALNSCPFLTSPWTSLPTETLRSMLVQNNPTNSLKWFRSLNGHIKDVNGSRASRFTNLILLNLVASCFWKKTSPKFHALQQKVISKSSFKQPE